jgi:hypothetical protein
VSTQKSDPINTAPIQQYLQQVKAADSSNQREIRLDIQTAKRLAFTLGEVMTRLNGDLEKLLVSQARGDNETIEINLDGGSNW